MNDEQNTNATDRHSGIVTFCESFLAKHGDTYLGVGWTKCQEDADTRYRLMLEVIKEGGSGGEVSLLDFGCGASHLYEYISQRNLTHIKYSGLDLSDKFLALSKSKFPATDYYRLNLLETTDEERLPEFDYIVMNGVFTAKCELSFDEMLSYFKALTGKVFGKARNGIAFNVMSKLVDWERDDLFHLPFDLLASFLAENVSRHFIIRHDYRLYEYTVYVYR